jgi:hypothetical protein
MQFHDEAIGAISPRLDNRTNIISGAVLAPSQKKYTPACAMS